jgi:hypothetical protein
VTSAPPLARSAVPIGAALLLALALGLTLAGLLMGLTTLGSEADLFGPAALMSTVVTNVAFGIVGALIVMRLPANLIGWLLLGTGLAGSGGFVAVAFEGWSSTLATPAVGLALVTWIGATSWYLMIGFLFPRLLLLLPDGRLPSPRWRPVDILQGIVLVALGILIAGEALTLLEPVPVQAQPFLGFAAVVEQYGYVLVLALMLVAAVSMVVRLRRSTGVERLQLKWIGWVVLILVVGLLLSGVLEIVSPAASDAVGSLAFAVIGMLPVAIGIAVLRFRLYDIDRLISRTIGWAVASSIVVGAFLGAVVALQAALAGFTEGQTLAVAGSTLVAFALFQPVRRRVQHAVDRRFDRARYDGERTAAAFAERLRNEVGLTGVESDVSATVTGALRPRSLGVWIRGAVTDDTR